MGIGVVDFVRTCTDDGGSIWHHPKYYIRNIDIGVPYLYKTWYAFNENGRKYAQGLLEVRKCISRPPLPTEARENRVTLFS